MCTSVTGAFTTIGVSTSSRPRSKKKWRACVSTAERCSSIERVAVGFHSTMTGHHPAPQPGQRLAHRYAVARLHARQPVTHVGRQDQNHCRTHVETAHLNP